MKPADSSKDKATKLILYVVFPIIQLFFLLLVFLEIASPDTFSFPLLLFMLLFSIVFIILFLYLFYVQQKHKRVKASLTELNQLHSIKKRHYSQIREHREELEKYKNSISKDLGTILECIKNKDTASVHIYMDALTKQLSDTREYPYCNNPIINAVLTRKSMLCKEKGISLSIHISICRFEAIRDLHLCSIFSNLTDNAIHACESLPEDNERFIHISAKEFGDYLFIKFVNPSSPPEKNKPLSGHGYGQKIIRDISQQYQGHFDTEYSSGQYTATVSLLLQKKCTEDYS